MVRYKLVLFDSDGTLVDSLPWFRVAFNEVSVRHGLPPVSEADQELLRGLTTGELLKHLRVPLLKMPALMAAMRRLMGERKNVRGILGPENAGLISFWACGASMFGKPSKLRTVLKSAGVSARDTIYLGDEVRDAEAARKVGMDYGAVAWGYHRIETLRAQGPAEVFLQPAEIGERLG
jgi:phosphoglycolate phosphatase